MGQEARLDRRVQIGALDGVARPAWGPPLTGETSDVFDERVREYYVELVVRELLHLATVTDGRAHSGLFGSTWSTFKSCRRMPEPATMPTSSQNRSVPPTSRIVTGRGTAGLKPRKGSKRLRRMRTPCECGS